MVLDERLHRELEHAARPADPTGVYEGLIRRHERRKIVRRVQAGWLALVVLLGTIGGFYALTRVFGGNGEIATSATDTNGRLALALYSEPPTQRIALINPDGTGIRFLTSGDAMDTTPAWSPDGTQLVYWRAGPDVRGGLWVMSADGSDAHPLLETDVSIRAIEWSPDGSRIAFIQIQIPTGPSTELDFSDDLYVMNANGTAVTPLITDGQVEDFDWSPDGTQLVIERQYALKQSRLGYDLAVVDADGGAAERPLTSNGSSRDPTWSPDGSTIVYVSSERSGDFFDPDLFAIAPDGTEGVQLTHDPATEENPVFSPDGSLVAFTRFPNDDGSACELVVMKQDGSEASVIGSKDTLGGCPLSLAWQPVAQGEQVSPLPSPSETSIESATPDVGEDIGLGFPVCNVTSVSGTFAPETVGTAYVATKASDTGGCAETGFQVVAVDVTGDGVADASYGPVECDPFCSAFVAADADGDGTDELFVQNIQFSIAGLRLYEVRADPPEVFPVIVSTPGYPEGDLPPGAEPQFWIGGDGFRLDTLRCFASGGIPGRVLIQTSASEVPPDSPDSVWQATATWFAIDPDGTVSVVDAGTFEEPVTEDGPTFAQEGGICGARLPPPYGVR